MGRVNKLNKGMKGTIESDVTLELDRAGVQGRVTARQGDALVHKFRVRLNLHGHRYTPASATLAQLYGLRADGESVSCDGMILPDGQVELIPGGGFFACGGPVICRLVLRGDDGGELYSPAFAIDAEPAFGEGADPVPAEQYSRMEELLLQVLDAKRTCERLVAEINGVTLSDDAPLADGTASAGVSGAASRADHVHPTDGSRMPADIAALGAIRGIVDTVTFLVADPAGDPKYASWPKIVDAMLKKAEPETSALIAAALKTAVVGVARAVSDEKGINYAFLPEDMENDGVIALRSDIENIPTEEWTFTLADGTAVTKKVMLG